MKKKFITSEEWGSAILPNSRNSFSTISPFKIIGNGPHFAWNWAGVPSCVSGPSVPVGTIYGSRFGCEDDKITKTDEWLVFDRGGSVLLQDVQEHTEIPDHHSEGVPVAFRSAPKTIKGRFRASKAETSLKSFLIKSLSCKGIRIVKK